MIPFVALLFVATNLAAQPPVQPGPLPGGGNRLISGWITRPAGQQIPLSNLPMTSRLSPDGQWLFILQAGHARPSVSAHRAATGELVDSLSLPDAWLGLALSDNRLLVGGGASHAVHELAWTNQKLQLLRSWKANDPSAFLGDVQINHQGRVFAASLLANAILEFDPASGRQINSLPTGPLPYRILPETNQLLVSSWSGAALHRHRLDTGAIDVYPAADHSSDLLRAGNHYFVAAANTNLVLKLSENGAIAERINISLTPRQPVGMTPSALALSSDGKTLYVVCSDANAVALVDISNPERSRVLGFLPTGWYPTSIQALPDGRLAVLNGKGLRSFPNNTPEEKKTFSYVASLQKGSLSLIPPVTPPQLLAYSQTVIANTPYKDELLDRVAIPSGNPVPSRPGQPSPIKHVIYIVKENRTYDQVFGGFGKGNGDPSLVLFGEKEGPNHFKLAREFVLFDNFYVNGDVSADGHIWSSGAIAPDYTQKLYPNLYAGRGGPFSLYFGRPPVNHSGKAAHPAGGYLWDAAFEKGLSVRNYGWLVTLIPSAKDGEKQWSEAASERLAAVTNPYFRGFDTNFPDIDRMKYFLRDLAEAEKTGNFPALTVMRLGNDHTSGFRAGAYTPAANFADNDLALGQLVESVSKSKFWKNTAIFVLEDDAQSGPDHVDSHRSIAFVISPYTRRRGLVDSTMYNTTSMLRTIGLILGTRPLTHYDAAATPMWKAFQRKPDLRPYQLEPPGVSLTERNPVQNKLAARSAKLDLSEADRIEDEEMNDILYLGIQGRPAPSALRSWFGQ
jgi:DNA-binding beta-propeller fold protein YncE